MIREVHLRRSEFNDIPWKFEAGTPAVGDAIGLGVAAEYLGAHRHGRVRAHERDLVDVRPGAAPAARVPGIELYGPLDPDLRGGVVPFNLPGHPSARRGPGAGPSGIAVRAGHHCTMPLHERLDLAATARASFSVYSTTAATSTPCATASWRSSASSPDSPGPVPVRRRARAVPAPLARAAQPAGGLDASRGGVSLPSSRVRAPSGSGRLTVTANGRVARAVLAAREPSDLERDRDRGGLGLDRRQLHPAGRGRGRWRTPAPGRAPGSRSMSRSEQADAGRATTTLGRLGPPPGPPAPAPTRSRGCADPRLSRRSRARRPATTSTTSRSTSRPCGRANHRSRA